MEILACDLVKDPKAVYDYCHEKGIEVSVLVNNAGYGDYKKFVDADLDKLLGMIDLNNKALVALTHYFVKDMKEMGYGHIINVGSVASFMPGPYMAVYYASKAFVMSFSLALREELKKDSIKVSVLFRFLVSGGWQGYGDEYFGLHPHADRCRQDRLCLI